MMRFLLGFVTAIVVLVVAAGAYLRLGLAPVATSAPPLPFERLITKMALHARIVVEPTGAVGAAAVLAGRLPLPRGARVGVVLSGGNIDPDLLIRILQSS